MARAKVEPPRPQHVRVNIDAARKDDHAGRVNRSTAKNVGDDAAVVDADVFDDAVDVVGGVVDFAAGDAKHAGSHYDLSHRERLHFFLLFLRQVQTAGATDFVDAHQIIVKMLENLLGVGSAGTEFCHVGDCKHRQAIRPIVLANRRL